MALSKGQEHLKESVGIVQQMLQALSGERGDDGPLSDGKGALERVLTTLDGLEDSFFLKSNLCLYFTKRLLTATERTKRALDDALVGDGGAPPSLERAIPRLIKAAETLADRAQMRDGVTLT